jgi:hypothetical protein
MTSPPPAAFKVEFQTHPNYNPRRWLIKEGKSARGNLKDSRERSDTTQMFKVEGFIEEVTVWQILKKKNTDVKICVQ